MKTYEIRLVTPETTIQIEWWNGDDFVKETESFDSKEDALREFEDALEWVRENEPSWTVRKWRLELVEISIDGEDEIVETLVRKEGNI